MRDGLGARRPLHLLQRAPVVVVLMRGDDRRERPAVDQFQVVAGSAAASMSASSPGLRAAQQIGIVVHRADGDLGDGQAGQLPGVRWPADGHVS